MTTRPVELLCCVDPDLGPTLPPQAGVGSGTRVMREEDVLQATSLKAQTVLHVIDRPAPLSHPRLESHCRQLRGTYLPVMILGTEITVGPISRTDAPCSTCAWRRRETRRDDPVVSAELIAWHRAEAGLPAFRGFLPADISAAWSFALALARDAGAGNPPPTGVVWSLDVQRTSWTAHRFLAVWSCPVCARFDARATGSSRVARWVPSHRASTGGGGPR